MSRSIVTLSPKIISQYLVRHRRGETLERYQPRIDLVLQEILGKVNEFVPSEAGAILLDDPKAKLLVQSRNQLTIIAAFGERAKDLLGQQLPPERGLAGRVYSRGRAMRCLVEDEDRALQSELESRTSLKIRSLLGVPLLLGTAICGVILLINRLGRESYSEENHTLLEIFAAYISSQIQNTLDGMRAKELAQKDDLTGLYNDRYLYYRLRSEIQGADREGTCLSLLFFDLDHFKWINDRFGHLEGSRILHLIGILLEGEMPSRSVAARYGGDEFVVILPGSDAQRAMQVAERLRQKVASTPFRIDSSLMDKDPEEILISASLGVSSLHEHVLRDKNNSQRANCLIRLADQAMYKAKAAGRNRVMLATGEVEE